MKNNYIIKNKEEIKKILKNTRLRTQKNLADEVGVGQDYISQIFNGRSTTKPTAYAITKAISSDAEIKNFFETIC